MIVIFWANYEFAWGGSYQCYYKEQSLNGCAILEHELQPIRFQGQFFDTETSLHYNRFRYYDTDVGMFIQRDPIGLLGGSNVFAYTPNPIHWVDVLGLMYVAGPRSPIVISGKDKRNASTIDISEWRRKVCRKDIAKERLKFLGNNYVKVEAGKWRSIDGRRQFRVKPADYAGPHGMGFPIVLNTPHIHMEFLTPKPNGANFTVTKNIHIPLKDCYC